MKRISMWSGPRNVSTAVMYSFAQRPDTKVVDEPLYGYYLSKTSAEHPGHEYLLENLEKDAYAILHEMIHYDFDKEIVFFKNMAHHLFDMDEISFVNEFDNIILIRDPKEVITSLSKTLNRIELRDTAFEFQWKLYDYLTRHGKQIIVIDSQDLLQDPSNYLKILCDELGIRFYDSMLSWGKGGIPEDGIWAKYWYHNIHKSEGFIEYKEKDVELPASLETLYQQCQEYYLLLTSRKLTIHEA